MALREEHLAECRVRKTRVRVVVSSLVSSVYVRLRSLVFKLTGPCRSRTLTVFGELLSQPLKSERSAIYSHSRAGFEGR